jgi:hypothetical protein
MPRRHVELALLECLDEIGLALAGRADLIPTWELPAAVEPEPPEPAEETLILPARPSGTPANGTPSGGNGTPANGNGVPVNGTSTEVGAADGEDEDDYGTAAKLDGEERRTPLGDELHRAVERVLACLSVADTGDLAATEEETNDSLDDARSALTRYREAGGDERSASADLLAAALEGLLGWPREHEGDFADVLQALESAEARYALAVSPSNE